MVYGETKGKEAENYTYQNERRDAPASLTLLGEVQADNYNTSGFSHQRERQKQAQQQETNPPVDQQARSEEQKKLGLPGVEIFDSKLTSDDKTKRNSKEEPKELAIKNVERNGEDIIAEYSNGDIVTWRDGKIVRNQETKENEVWDNNWENGKLRSISGKVPEGDVLIKWENGRYVATLNGQPSEKYVPFEGKGPINRFITMDDFHYEEPLVSDSTTAPSKDSIEKLQALIGTKDERELVKYLMDMSTKGCDWQSVADAYETQTGKSLQADLKTVFSDADTLTLRVNFSHRPFPFEEFQSLNRLLPSKDSSQNALSQYPGLDGVIDADTLARVQANEVRFRVREFDKESQEDWADSLYRNGLLPTVSSVKGRDVNTVSIGPAQMQVGKIEELKAEARKNGKSLDGLDPTNPNDAQVFVAAYFDSYRKKFEEPSGEALNKETTAIKDESKRLSQDADKLDAEGKTEEAKNKRKYAYRRMQVAESIEWCRELYLQSKSKGDKKGMQNALTRTYNPNSPGTDSDDNSGGLAESYGNPYKR